MNTVVSVAKSAGQHTLPGERGHCSLPAGSPLQESRCCGARVSHSPLPQPRAFLLPHSPRSLQTNTTGKFWSLPREAHRKVLCYLSPNPFMPSTAGESHTTLSHRASCLPRAKHLIQAAVLVRQEKHLSASSLGQQQECQEPKPAGDTRDVKALTTVTKW